MGLKWNLMMFYESNLERTCNAFKGSNKFILFKALHNLVLDTCKVK